MHKRLRLYACLRGLNNSYDADKWIKNITVEEITQEPINSCKISFPGLIKFI